MDKLFAFVADLLALAILDLLMGLFEKRKTSLMKTHVEYPFFLFALHENIFIIIIPAQ
jgi:hypothetical protein